MTDSQIPALVGKQTTALDELRAFMRERQAARTGDKDFETFEREARRRFAAAEAEFVAEELARLTPTHPQSKWTAFHTDASFAVRRHT